jgi:hypothetical protein
MKTVLRKFKETDRDFITRSVLMSFMNGSKEVQKINRDSYMRAHNTTLNKLLDKCECIVSCDPEDQDLVYGFALYDNGEVFDVLHYIYVRKTFRKNRVAAELLSTIQNKRNLAISHLTDDFRPARLKKYWEKVIYDCYLRIV